MWIMSVLRYSNTDDEVRVGDLIRVKRFLRSPIEAYVVYVPGQSQLHSELEYDGVKQWAYQTADGTVWASGFFPKEVPFASKKISLIRRTNHPGIGPEYLLQRRISADRLW